MLINGIMTAAVLLAALIVFFIIVIIRDSNRFVRVDYRICSDMLRRKCRIIMLSDLHNKEYGKNNEKLVQAIDQAKPDLILIAGDMLTAEGEKTRLDVALGLMKRLAEKYPVYYGMGNHEHRMKVYTQDYGDLYLRYVKELGALGVKCLENERVYLPESNLEICGLEIERPYYKRLKLKKMEAGYVEGLIGKSRKECFELLIAHNPDYFERYANWGADLVLAGHVHGGVARLPLLGGVISPMLHLFPKYDGGLFREYDSTMILGRGLGMHTIPVRMFNPGELVVISLEP